jgi:hypothetical protein
VKKNTKIYFLWIIFGILIHPLNAGMPTATPSTSTSTGALSGLLSSTSQGLTHLAQDIKDGLKNIGNQLKTISYQTAKDTINLVPAQNITLDLDFGYSGHGDLSDFKGLTITLQLPGMLSMLTSVAMFPLKEIFGGAVNSNVLTTTPTMEFLLRFMTLINTPMDSKAKGQECLLLLTRLTKTQGINSFSDAFRQIPGPLGGVLQPLLSFRLPGIDSSLDDLFGLIKFCMAQDFSDTSEIHDTKMGIELVSAVVIQYYLAILPARDKLAAQPKDPALQQALTAAQAAAKKAALANAVKVAVRLQPIKNTLKSITDKIRPLAAMLGVGDVFDILVGMLLQEKAPQAQAPLPDQTADLLATPQATPDQTQPDQGPTVDDQGAIIVQDTGPVIEGDGDTTIVDAAADTTDQTGDQTGGQDQGSDVEQGELVLDDTAAPSDQSSSQTDGLILN